jgi:hypothetical protein
MWRAPLFVFVVATTALALLGRLVLVAATSRRWPAVAAGVDRWWAWTPLAALCGFFVWTVPWLGVAMTAGTLIALTRSDAIGSPFRPRR